MCAYMHVCMHFGVDVFVYVCMHVRVYECVRIHEYPAVHGFGVDVREVTVCVLCGLDFFSHCRACVFSVV